MIVCGFLIPTAIIVYSNASVIYRLYKVNCWVNLCRYIFGPFILFDVIQQLYSIVIKFRILRADKDGANLFL